MLLVGDSITLNYQDAAAAELQARGYQVFRDGIPGTGLLDASECDGSYARSLLAYVDPDIVVFENNGNYMIRDGAVPCSPPLKVGSKQWLNAWKASARQTQKILRSARARFTWVLVPIANFEPKRTIIPKLNAIYRKLSRKRTFVDAFTAFGGNTWHPEYHYDEQHLNGRGAQLLTDLVVETIG